MSEEDKKDDGVPWMLPSFEEELQSLKDRVDKLEEQVKYLNRSHTEGFPGEKGPK